MGALLGSLERGKWSAIGYTVARFNAEDSEGNNNGDSLFLGSGLAYTPNEGVHTGRLFSYQAGWSFEHYSRDRVKRQPDANTGGDEMLIHPTVVYSPGHGLLFFGIVSVPVWHDFKDVTAQDGTASEQEWSMPGSCRPSWRAQPQAAPLARVSCAPATLP
jgi:hypothetical protein